MDKIRSNRICRCQQLSTVDSNHQQTQWYKDMYGQIHKSPEKKKDVILVKLPPTSSRYRDQTQNPYKPTYTFPEEFDGDFDKMERYMRRAASEDIDEIKNTQTSTNIKTDHQPPSSSTANQIKTTTDVVSSSITINPNTSSIRPVDSEHRNVYKRILRGGDIPSTGLQKISANNRDRSNEKDGEQTMTTPLSRPNNFQPISRALALHHFHAQTNRELSFKKGDTILVKRRINDDWLEGEYQSQLGIFPVSYVELFPYENADGEAIVKYDFLAEKPNELTLKKDERVVLIRKLEHNWYEGRINQREGIFPGDHVEIIKTPTKSILKTSNNLQQSSVSKMNIVPDSTLPMQRCQVLYDYTPKNPDELEIHAGDIIKIIEMCDDGWYCGIMEKTNHNNANVFGTFPGNYVKILPI